MNTKRGNREIREKHGEPEADRECGGKRSATPLSNDNETVASIKVPSADDRRQLRSAGAVHASGENGPKAQVQGPKLNCQQGLGTGKDGEKVSGSRVQVSGQRDAGLQS